jgi:hypothetical protein
MTFIPCNRYLLIERKSRISDRQSLIELPEGSFNALPENRYERVHIKGISSDIRPPMAVGHDIVVLGHMIEEVAFGNETVYLVLENHVLGIVGGAHNEQ